MFRKSPENLDPHYLSIRMRGKIVELQADKAFPVSSYGHSQFQDEETGVAGWQATSRTNSQDRAALEELGDAIAAAASSFGAWDHEGIIEEPEAACLGFYLSTVTRFISQSEEV